MRLYLKFFAIHLKSEMAYSASFFMSCGGRLLYTLASLFSIHILMNRFGVVSGHTLGEILLGFGVVMTAYNIAECFARGFDSFEKIIRQGQLDRLLVRPKPLVFQVICQDMRLASLTNILIGGTVIAYAIKTSGIFWTVPKVLVLIAMVLCGSLLFFGAYLMFAALCFLTQEGLEVMNIFTDGIREYSRYPYDVYGKGVLWFTTIVMPACAILAPPVSNGHRAVVVWTAAASVSVVSDSLLCPVAAGCPALLLGRVIDIKKLLPNSCLEGAFCNFLVFVSM